MCVVHVCECVVSVVYCASVLCVWSVWVVVCTCTYVCDALVCGAYGYGVGMVGVVCVCGLCVCSACVVQVCVVYVCGGWAVVVTTAVDISGSESLAPCSGILSMPLLEKDVQA